MRPTVMLFCTDAVRSQAFYEALGFTFRRAQRTGGWIELEWGDLVLNLHEWPAPLPAAGRHQLGLEVGSELEGVVERLKAAGLADELDIVDEAFGRIVHLRDPDGNLVNLTEQQPELYV